jgi:hypothetical protein
MGRASKNPGEYIYRLIQVWGIKRGMSNRSRCAVSCAWILVLVVLVLENEAVA